MDEAWEPSATFSSEPWNTSAPAADGTGPACGGGGWLTGRAEGVRPGVSFRRITTWDSGGVDLTGGLPPAGAAASFSVCPSTAILRFMYFSKMASRRAFSSAFRRSLSSSLLLQWTIFLVSCTSLPTVLYHKISPNYCKRQYCATDWTTHTHTHTRLTALCPGLPGWAGTRKVKPIWSLLKQEVVSSSGISWAICKSAPRSRQITTPAPHRWVFYRPDALPAAKSAESATLPKEDLCHEARGSWNS